MCSAVQPFRLASRSVFLHEGLASPRSDGSKARVERGGSNRVGSYALIDCGPTGFASIDEQFVSQRGLPRHQLRASHAFHAIDGRSVSSGGIAELVRAPLDIWGHKGSGAQI